MKAVIFKELGVIEVQDVPEPEPTNDQIKVKIAYAGICGSDPIIVIGGSKNFPIRKAASAGCKNPARPAPAPKSWAMKHPAPSSKSAKTSAPISKLGSALP